MLIKSPEEMFAFGTSLAQTYTNLLLYGDLGAGKTTLTKGFATGLGIDHTLVQSPTYTYTNTYQQKLLHIDMYRLEQYQDLVEKGIKNQILESEYVVIERPKFTEHLQLEKCAVIHIEKYSDIWRKITIT